VLVESLPLFIAGVIRFSMRETTLEEHLAKKAFQYRAIRNYYPDPFAIKNSRRFESSWLLERSFGVGKEVVGALEEVAEGGPLLRRFFGKDSALAGKILGSVPREVLERGHAVTWPSVQLELERTAKSLSIEPVAAQKLFLHTYFSLHSAETDLSFLTALPYLSRDIYLPIDGLRYDYSLFSFFLGALGVSDVILDLPAELLAALTGEPSFLALRSIFDYLAFSSRTPQEFERQLASLLFHRKAPSRSVWQHLRTLQCRLSFRELLVKLGDLATEMDVAISAASDRFAENTFSRSALVLRKGRRTMKRVALFVPLDEERRILIDEFGMEFDQDTKRFAVTKGYVRYEAVCPNRVGRVAAAVEAMDALCHSSFDLVLVVGIAGGFSKGEVDRGDVVVATSIVDMATRKRVRDSGSDEPQEKIRPDEYQTLLAITRYVFSGAFDEREWRDRVVARDQHDWPRNRVPALRSGKISCLDEIVADSGYVDFLRELYPSVLGVEMEGAGVGAAAMRCAVPFGVIRGISDLADPYKADDKWRKLAMRGVAQLVKRLDLHEILARS